MKRAFWTCLVKSWPQFGVCAVIILLGGMARAEESKSDLFVRWLKVSAVGAPEAGLKILPEFKVDTLFDGTVCYAAESQGMSCRANVEDGKVRGSQVLALRDSFPEDGIRLEIEKHYGVTFPKPKLTAFGKVYRVTRDGVLITFGTGGNGTTINVGPDPNTAAPVEEFSRFDFMGVWSGKVIPVAEGKSGVQNKLSKAESGEGATLIVIIAPKECHFRLFTPDRKADPTGRKGFYSPTAISGTWTLKGKSITLTPDPEIYPAADYPGLRPLVISVAKPSEDRLVVSLGDFAASGLAFPKGNFKISLSKVPTEEVDTLLEKFLKEAPADNP